MTTTELIRTGDIVCVSYADFEGEKQVGIFLVLYSEKQDRHYIGNKSNLLAAKVTSNSFQADNYSVKLLKGESNLDKDCLVCLSKLHTFLPKQVYKRIGSVSQSRMINIYKEYKRFLNETDAQLFELF